MTAESEISRERPNIGKRGYRNCNYYELWALRNYGPLRHNMLLCMLVR